MTDLDADEALRIIQGEGLALTANWYGLTGRGELSAWIDRDGDDWLVWQTDERASVFHDPIRYTSEPEALAFFLQLARSFQASDAEYARSIAERRKRMS